MSLASVNESVSISTLFERRIPATVELGVLSLIVVVTVAVPIGVLAALKPGSKRKWRPARP